MNWREYEEVIFETLRRRFPADQVRPDLMVPGRFSKIDRQIDVVGTSSILGHVTLAIVDCKCYSRRVDVKDVESAIGMAADVKADVALIVTTVGYTDAAKNRSANEPNVRLHLDIITLGDANSLKNLPTVAVMYRGKVAAVVIAPSGWLVTSNIVDGKRVLPIDAMCYLHENCIDVDSAFRQRSIGWCFIDDNPKEQEDYLNHVLQMQEKHALEYDPKATINLWSEGDEIIGRKFLIRRIDYVSTGYIDHTLFIEPVSGVVFWACMLSVGPNVDSVLERLRFVGSKIVFAYAPNADPENSHGVWSGLVSQIVSEQKTD